MYRFAGGDGRAYWTVDYLRKKGIAVGTHQVPGMEDTPLPDKIGVLLLPYPIPENWSGMDTVIEWVQKDCLVIGGCFRSCKERLEAKGARVIDICDREPLVTLNAVGTVEGALSLMIRQSDITLWESKCLVIGGGRIGMLLAERLRDLGSRVTVAVRSRQDRGKARSRGLQTDVTGKYENGLGEYDFVINTVPAPVLHGQQLKGLKKDCLYIELASAPGGIAQKDREELQLKILHAPGLPGRFSPKTAGILYGECILDVLKEEGVL